MKRYRVSLGILLLFAAVAVGTWTWQTWRTVDGRTAREWVAFAHDASMRVSYHASGKTTLQGIPATFSLAQGEQGRYAMTVNNAQGQQCELGDDGQSTWYRTQARTVRTAKTASPPMPPDAKSRILGIGQIAGRRSVRLLVQSGQVQKELTLDRETGVTLAMVTRERQRTISDMRVEKIAYQPVVVNACAAQTTSVIHAATRAQLKHILGTDPVMPTWLPAGMTARGSYREWCNCCRREIAVLRYSDGLRALTLFEAAGDHNCVMAEGCHMAPTGSELIESRRVGAVTVIAVGNVDHDALQHVLSNLR